MTLLLTVFVFILSNVILAEYVTYKGIMPKTTYDIYQLKLFKINPDYDFWSDVNAVNSSIDVMVAPKSQRKFLSTLTKYHMKYKILINDVQDLLDAERLNQKNADVHVKRGHLINFKRYHRYDHIVRYFKKLSDVYKHKVKLRIYGYSSEGRPLYALKVFKNPENPTILIEGGMHGREWMSTSVVLYIISQIVERNRNKDLVNNLNWVFAPLVNPDGYEYSHTIDRFWKKTRSLGIICDGVDGNRNFPFRWMGKDSSSHECSQNYAGKQALSEPETNAFANLTYHIMNLQLFISIHEYGPWILYSKTKNPNIKNQNIKNLEQNFIDTIYFINYTKYKSLDQYPILNYGSGTSIDWIQSLGVELSYYIGLPLPYKSHEHHPSEIIQISNEVWHGIQVFCNYLLDKSMYM